jgi:hypothetical protein
MTKLTVIHSTATITKNAEQTSVTLAKEKEVGVDWFFLVDK